jgi:mannose-1-phosphate guanylyltransferase
VPLCVAVRGSCEISFWIPLPQIPNLAQIYLLGFYEEREFALYVSSISNELRIPVRYLREDKPHGSAGGIYSFRDYIMEDGPSHIVLLNCDVCSSFPLPDMLGRLPK